MTYSIVYTSMTGNTALLAEKVRAILPVGRCVYCGAPAPQAAEADLIFVGFWTDKGTCGKEIAAFLEHLEEKKVFLFGTAGFGGSGAYFNQIMARVSSHVRNGSAVAGAYMCQGKMPPSVRARFAAMEDGEKARPMLENFDRALTHPDASDLARLELTISETLLRGECKSKPQ